jgi:hypothetical protein
MWASGNIEAKLRGRCYPPDGEPMLYSLIFQILTSWRTFEQIKSHIDWIARCLTAELWAALFLKFPPHDNKAWFAYNHALPNRNDDIMAGQQVSAFPRGLCKRQTDRGNPWNTHPIQSNCPCRLVFTFFHFSNTSLTIIDPAATVKGSLRYTEP